MFTRIIIPVTAIFMALPCIKMHSQILYSNGATFYVATGGVLFSNGGVELTQTTSFTNEGTFTVTKNSTFPFPGNFYINTSTVAGGNGNYRIEQDWINDASFNPDNSTVELYGNTAQIITTNTAQVTIFNNLILTGSGTGNNRKKILSNIDAGIGATGTLAINDRELSTGTNTFTVLNPSATCVTNNVTAGNEGFVSSLAPGYFMRVTNTPNPYLFPTGSSLGTLRYRPVIITAQPGVQSAYNARLNNNDASTDGFDRNALANDVCQTNELFYHSITRSAGAANADVTLSYLPAADGSWAHMARWQTGNAQWNNLDPVATGNLAGFNTVTKTGWAFPDADHPFILSDIRPLPPSITNCPSICANSVVNFSATGSAGTYQWNVPSGVAIQSGQGSANISVLWGSQANYITVIATGANGCNSLPDSCQPTILETPTADFTTISQGGANTINFLDESTYATQWAWDFGDGNTSALQSPQYTYTTPGNYQILLTITSKDGCVAQATTVITVEGDPVYIPNSFTPNEDFTNEGFRPINRSGEGVAFEIYNRWGERIFKSEDPKIGWDGTYGGKPCPLDVYVYKVYYKDSNGASKTFIGHVNLIR